MKTITTYDAHCGTAVKHEQPGSCSTKYGNKNNRTNHGGDIARRLMPLLLFIFALVGGTAWGQTEIDPGTHELQCGTTYNYKATAEGTYIFINKTGADITISGITVNTLKRKNSSTYDFVIIKDTYHGNSDNGYSQSCDDSYYKSFTVDNVTIASGDSAIFQILTNITNNRKENCKDLFVW